MKLCSDCAIEKSIAEFHNSATAKDGKQYRCKVCQLARIAKQNALDPDHRYRVRRNSWLKLKFGITLEEYEEMALLQNNVCFLCSKPCQKNGPLSVDHDHQTGRIRGLLCYRCNTAIGALGDDIMGLLMATLYTAGKIKKGQPLSEEVARFLTWLNHQDEI